ncbi:MAG: DUF378 domain-containing protein [Defluviitaleaceae bacterium]|nr:DUF378 domain-containing protein [Defluviitaleaceae bacterium]
MKPLDWFALSLIILGAIDLGLIGFFRFDLIGSIFGGMTSWFARIIYALIGLAGIYAFSMYGRIATNDLARGDK